MRTKSARVRACTRKAHKYNRTGTRPHTPTTSLCAHGRHYRSGLQATFLAFEVSDHLHPLPPFQPIQTPSRPFSPLSCWQRTRRRKSEVGRTWPPHATTFTPPQSPATAIIARNWKHRCLAKEGSDAGGRTRRRGWRRVGWWWRWVGPRRRPQSEWRRRPGLTRQPTHRRK